MTIDHKMSVDNLSESEREKMFTRKIFLLALMLLAVMAFTGCDNTPPRPQKPDSVIVEEETIKIATPAGFVRVDGWFPTADRKLRGLVNEMLAGQEINFLAIFCSDEKSWKKIAKSISKDPNFADSNFISSGADQVEIVMLLEVPFLNQMVQSSSADSKDTTERDKIFSGFAEYYEKMGGHTFGNVPNTVLGYLKMSSKSRKQGHGHLVSGMMIIKKQCLLNISIVASKKENPAHEMKIKNASEQWVLSLQKANGE